MMDNIIYKNVNEIINKIELINNLVRLPINADYKEQLKKLSIIEIEAIKKLRIKQSKRKYNLKMVKPNIINEYDEINNDMLLIELMKLAIKDIYNKYPDLINI